MNRVLRFALWSLISFVALGAVLGGLFAYFAYSPAQEVPQLSGTLGHGSIEAGGLKRTYLIYLPRSVAKGAPLVVVMHGSGMNGAEVRGATGYGFDRLADQHGFAVVYPDAYEGDWNACNRIGDTSDDVGFLTRLVDKVADEIGVDKGRVFAAGVSRGGAMALRLALEAPSRFRAVAAVSASVPVPEDFKCKQTVPGTSSVMIMNGTLDPLSPFDGGEISLLGLAYRFGKIRSSRESAQYFANLNALAGRPETNWTDVADGIQVEQIIWRGTGWAEVELVAIHGGGHGLPQPYHRGPRLLGPSPTEPNGPAMIWDFFARQQPIRH